MINHWKHVSENGMATNLHSIHGGIIDVNLPTNTWFVIPNYWFLSPMEGFESKEAAFAGLKEALAGFGVYEDE